MDKGAFGPLDPRGLAIALTRRHYPFLLPSWWEDVEQTGSLAYLIAPGDLRVLERELYALARAAGWRQANRPGSWNSKTWIRADEAAREATR